MKPYVKGALVVGITMVSFSASAEGLFPAFSSSEDRTKYCKEFKVPKEFYGLIKFYDGTARQLQRKAEFYGCMGLTEQAALDAGQQWADHRDRQMYGKLTKDYSDEASKHEMLYRCERARAGYPVDQDLNYCAVYKDMVRLGRGLRPVPGYNGPMEDRLPIRSEHGD